MKNAVNIFILIDALGWNYIKDRPFLSQIAVTKRRVKSILGFSSGVIPSILTGKYPREHKHWSLYFYSPETSPFKWIRKLLWVPKNILNTRLSRKIIEETSKRIMKYKGYFETYLIPVEHLHLFDICENKNIYKPKGVRGAESIFDILKDKGIDYKCFTYPLKDREIFTKAKMSFKNTDSKFYFLYLSESDRILHSSCKDKVKVEEMIDSYEKEIKTLYETAKTQFEHVNLYVFSDHGMACVDKSFNLKKEIEVLGFKMPKDYAVFYDATMARFWFFNPEAKKFILEMLKSKNCGRILTSDELKNLGIDFEDSMYGETIFLMNSGSVIIPSFMGNKTPQGMHGFTVDDDSMDAVLISNKSIEQDVKDVSNLFNIMTNHVMRNTSLDYARDRQYAIRKLKILYFLNSTVRAGAEEHVLRLIERLDRNTFEPILVCPKELIDVMKEDLERGNFKYYPVCIRRWRHIREINKFLHILKKEKPDIVHSHQFFATRFVAPIAKFMGAPKVIETAHVREGWRKGIKKAYVIDRFFYRFVDKVIAVSEAIKKYLMNEKKLVREKIELIHNGIDIEKFKLSKQTNNNNNFRIGVIGRLEPQKGHIYFLEAVEMLNGKYRDVEFTIVGEGSLKSELELKCRDLKIENRVEFLGFKKDILSVFNELDLLVLPSLYEGLPLVALEAGASGKPIVATNVDGTTEAVINNKTGILVPSKDSQALNEAIEKLLNDRNSIIEYGKNARKHIEKNFNITKQINKTEELYKRLVKRSLCANR